MSMLGKHHSKETKRKLSRATTVALLGHVVLEETRKKLRESTTRLWKTDEYRNKTIKATLKSCRTNRPNKAEAKLDDLLQQILPNEYKFVGDGEFVIAGKNPDFVNINGQKKIIELYGDYWHRNDDPQDRIDLFAEYGYSTLIIWEKELKNTSVLINRIIKFARVKT